MNWARWYTGAPTHALWGSSDHDVFAVGGTNITHYDGVSWSAQANGAEDNLFGVWGSAPDDVYAVGVRGTILHYDGVSWSAQASGTTRTLSGVWGSSKSNVFAVGDGVILHYDGVRWSLPSTADSPARVSAPKAGRTPA